MPKIKLLNLIVLLGLISFLLIQPQHKFFVLAGGGKLPSEVYEKFIQLAGGDNARIVVIPSASINPIKAASQYRYKHSVFYPNSSIEILRQATGIWFTGGDQQRLANLYCGTEVEKELKRLIANGVVIGGTSAGASIVSNIMIYGNGESKGFGFLDLIIDQHFTNRNRLNRLLHLVQKYSDVEGLGIDEETAVVLIDNYAEVIGVGNVTFCKNNIIEIYKSGQKFYVKK